MGRFFGAKTIQVRNAITTRFFIEKQIEKRVSPETALQQLKEFYPHKRDAFTTTSYDSLINQVSLYFKKEFFENNIDSFVLIYLLNTESLSDSFAQFTPKDLRNLKEALIILMIQSYEEYVSRATGEAHGKYVPAKYHQTVDRFERFVNRSKVLIDSARTVSGVIISLAIAANFACLYPEITDFALSSLQALTTKLHTSLTLKSANYIPNSLGPAFKFEQMREFCIKKLGDYLKERAVYTEKERSGNYLCQTYLPINRGFFYNTRLQIARIELASHLLNKLQFMIDVGQDIDSPQQLLQILQNAQKENERLYRFYGRVVDKQGELAKILEDLCQNLNDAYDWKDSNQGVYNPV
ncbi:hypothetical protein [Legionella hackeliae]|uniref:Uncharacterized protein n=1 Tax=Legionella hackeliae TaxID=449 RepID=A0A0A8UKZ2_LEGHA|nr:hypothetical protein [Legionella hackeliae]KTD13560.1 hypothetical protein Lhac_0944 [Legionella hackeliae]CEK09408.1 protein of unknown function [Legionella hackeliae]STX49316.1 Uncharacterised protein [Legionella hackeliae]